MNTTTTQKETEEAVNRSADSVGPMADRIQETVRQTQARLGEFQRELADRTRYAAESTDTYVHEKPWSAVCAAVSIGFVIGLLLGRR